MKITKSVFSCQRDTLTIRGTEYRPQGNHLPIAIVCHGFMAFQATVKQYAKILASAGYLTYTFDFCGGSLLKGKSDGSTNEMSVLTEVKDLACVVEYALSKNYSRKSSITLMGCSQGGFVCSLLAAKETYDISKLILFYPAFCIPDDARKGKMMLAKFIPSNPPETIWCGPMKLGKCYVEDVINMDFCNEIKHYKNSVLLLHGTKDSVVDPNYSMKAFEVYKNSNPKRNICFKLIKNGGHSFVGKPNSAAKKELKNFISFL